MNYYEHHIGDYAEATSHLTFIEDAAYSRLIRKYYSTEKPLPADIKAVERLVGARSAAERAAVKMVLAEFFSLRETGWHNDRCDEEIQRFKSSEPERAIRKANEVGRLKRHREERARLFADLHDVSQFPLWNIGIAELRAMHARFCGVTGLGSSNGTSNISATAPETPATATHSPLPTSHLPDTTSHFPVSKHVSLKGASDSDVVKGREHRDDVEFMDAFAAVRSAYPKFTGDQSTWLLAERAWRDRLEAGIAMADLQAGVERYGAFVKAKGVSGPQFVMTPNKFFDEHARRWTLAWEPPPTKSDAITDGNAAAAEEARLRIFGAQP